MNFLKKNHQHFKPNKIEVSKTFKSIVLLTLSLIISASCSKDDPNSNPQDNSGNTELTLTSGTVKKEDFEAYEGAIGIALDARPIARKGHVPTQVTLNVAATHGNYNQTIQLDEYSLMGQLKIPLEGLSDDAKDELIGGVDITPEYKDVNGNIIYTEQPFRRSFESNPSVRSANASTLTETEQNKTLSFRQGTSYYIQRMNADGSPDSGAWRHLPPSTGFADVITANATEFNGNEPDRSFTFIPIPGEINTFAIRHVESLKYIQVSYIPTSSGSILLHNAPNLSNRTSFSQIQGSADYDNFKFRLERLNNGSYTILSLYNGINGAPIKQKGGIGLTVDDIFTDAEDRYWRVVSTSIDWTVNNIGTSFLEPILPPAETSLSFNSILTNCGAGTLSQTVGVANSENQNITVGFEETLSMSTSNTVSVGVNINVEFSAQILGVGTTVNAGLETTYEHSWSQTQTSSNWQSSDVGESQTISSSRTVIVPAGSASLVYDVFQLYPETKVNFVQRMRVEGVDSETGIPLTGEEIRSQFYVSGFNGVVTAVEPNSIVITLRGTMKLDKIVDSESNVQDVPANCN